MVLTSSAFASEKTIFTNPCFLSASNEFSSEFLILILFAPPPLTITLLFTVTFSRNILPSPIPSAKYRFPPIVVSFKVTSVVLTTRFLSVLVFTVHSSLIISPEISCNIFTTSALVISASTLKVPSGYPFINPFFFNPPMIPLSSSGKVTLSSNLDASALSSSIPKTIPIILATSPLVMFSPAFKDSAGSM